jgi:integrase
MPYPRGKKWIAQVRKEGQRLEKVFLTKKEAKDWEAKMQRKPVEEWNKKTVIVCLNNWAQDYLDVSKVRFSTKTYKEKVSMFKRFFKVIDPKMPVAKLKPGDVLKYVVKQKEERSGYAANKDRKNLVAAWNWGRKYLDPLLPGPNPCLVDRMPEVRHPRYVPPEEDFWKIYAVAEGQDRVMLLTFLHLAARRGEVFRLTWQDVDFGNDRIRLWTRKRKDGSFEYDWLPMTKELRKSLRWWWEHRHRELNIFLKWRPQGDSNPCRRRERPVSWARLDDGDATFFTSGGPCWARTNDSLLKRQILYRLS